MSSPYPYQRYNLREGQVYNHCPASGAPLRLPERKTITVRDLKSFAAEGLVIVSDLKNATFLISAYILTQMGQYSLQSPTDSPVPQPPSEPSSAAPRPSVLPQTFDPASFQGG